MTSLVFTDRCHNKVSDFQQCGILTSVDSGEPVQPPLSLETPNNVQSVAGTHRIIKPLVKALIRIHVCTG